MTFLDEHSFSALLFIAHMCDSLYAACAFHSRFYYHESHTNFCRLFFLLLFYFSVHFPAVNGDHVFTNLDE